MYGVRIQKWNALQKFCDYLIEWNNVEQYSVHKEGVIKNKNGPSLRLNGS